MRSFGFSYRKKGFGRFEDSKDKLEQSVSEYIKLFPMFYSKETFNRAVDTKSKKINWIVIDTTDPTIRLGFRSLREFLI